MRFSGVCITTKNLVQLAEFYTLVFEEQPLIEGSHYSFSSVAIYDPGEDISVAERSIWLQCFCEDLDKEYDRLLQSIPTMTVISPPERRTWGAYSCWIADPDGNKIAVAQL